MARKWYRVILLTVPLAALLLWASVPTAGQGTATVKDVEWRTYGGDLRQHALLAARPDQRQQLQQAGSRLAVQDRQSRAAAGVQPPVDAADGQRRALLDRRHAARGRGARSPPPARCCGCTAMNEGKRGEAAPRQLSGRGLAYWTDGKEERILYVTPGYQMIALDAKTGRPVPGFGKNGIVDLKHETIRRWISITGEIGLHAAPVIAQGRHRHRRRAPAGQRAEEQDGTRKATSAASTCGPASASGSSTRFPQPGEFGNETWENDSWSYTGNAGVWAQMTVDEELGLVYLPVETPTGDYYGGHRPGANLFGESLVALDSRPASACGTTSSSITASGTGTFRARRSSPTSR